MPDWEVDPTTPPTGAPSRVCTAAGGTSAPRQLAFGRSDEPIAGGAAVYAPAGGGRGGDPRHVERRDRQDDREAESAAEQRE
eukprot:1189559-Prorocentrum_minimum.AAC.5